MSSPPPASPVTHTTTIAIQTGEEVTTAPPALHLLHLPLEVIGLILDHTLPPHPETAARDSTVYGRDTRSHGWSASNASLQQMKGYQAAYADQILALMKTCRTFYIFLRRRLYDSPLLLSPVAIRKFYSTIKASDKKPNCRLHTLVTTLVLHPSQQNAPKSLTDAWAGYLPKLFKRLSHLQTFSPGIFTSLIKMESIVSSLPTLPRLENLDNLDLFAAFVAFDPKSAQDGVLSLINRTSARLKRLSFSTINLLEPGCGVRQSSKFLTSAGARWPPAIDSDDEAEEFSPEDSCAPRFLQAIRAAKVGIEWEEEEEEGQVETLREKGIESIYFFGDCSIGVSVFHEMLVNLPNLRCLHLDAFTMLGPSLAESIPFYQARNKRLSLPKLVESFSVTNSHLTELTFAPMLVGSTLTSGKMDEILNYLPHLTHLEVRADFISPEFFRPLLASPNSPLVHLAIHILPPHAPPVFTSTVSTASHGTTNAAPQGAGAQGTAANDAHPSSDSDGDTSAAPTSRKTVAITVVQFLGRDQINAVAQAVDDMFFSEEYSRVVEEQAGDGGEVGSGVGVGGEKVCTWPKKSQEEFGDEDEQEEKFYEPVWYDLLMRLGRMALEMLRGEYEEEYGEEYGEEHQEAQSAEVHEGESDGESREEGQ